MTCAVETGRDTGPVKSQEPAIGLGVALWWKRLFRQDAAEEETDLSVLKSRIAELEQQLMTDAGTGIASKHVLFEHFERHALVGDYLLFLDLDDFKSVNKSYGHEVGNILLRRIAQAVEAVIGCHGIISRLSGDKFLVLVPADIGDIQALVDRMMQAAQQAHVEVGELPVSRKMSVGIAQVQAGMTLVEAVVAADAALALAKKKGKNQSAILREHDTALVPERPSVDEVRLALKRGEIGYHVQPIVNLATMRPEGYEALLRWTRPNGDVVGPALFLETMTDAYDLMTKPPLEDAHRTAAWAVLEQDAFISFNLSTAFLSQVASHGTDWVKTIAGEIPLNKIVFELVETIVARETDAISEVVAKLRACGVRVALDDFGIGQSTLERLQKVPVDIVKIDKQFLHMASRSERDMEILKAMVDLTRSTGAICCVEGIETQAHLDLVRMLEVDWVQGFFLGRPAPINAVG